MVIILLQFFNFLVENNHWYCISWTDIDNTKNLPSNKGIEFEFVTSAELQHGW